MTASTVLHLQRAGRSYDVGLVAWRGRLVFVDMATGDRVFVNLEADERGEAANGLKNDRALRRERTRR